jgi:hypothetical protein
VTMLQDVVNHSYTFVFSSSTHHSKDISHPTAKRT